MDYKKLLKALLCDGSGVGEDINGCTNKKCKYRDGDGGCNLVRMCGDAAIAINELLTENQALRNAANGFKKQAEAAETRAERAERKRDAAIKELNRVAAAVDELSDMIDSEVHPVVDYNLYLSLRENFDAISIWEYESEWRGLKEE